MSLRSQVVGALAVCVVGVAGPAALAEEAPPPDHAMHHHVDHRHPYSRFRHHHRGPAHEFGTHHESETH